MSTTAPGSVGQAFLAEARRRLVASHAKIAHCLAQLDDAQLWWRPQASMNSVANLVLHLCGNLRQWIVSGVGGATDVRNRPGEVAARGPVSGEELARRLEGTVREAESALARLDPARLLEPRRIQGFDETVLSAIFDSLTHLQGHTQEIVHLTRMQRGEDYRFAWVPQSAEQAGPAAAVKDAVFESGEVVPPPGGTPPAEQPPGSPLRDHLLELQQEFQDDEERGKL